MMGSTLEDRISSVSIYVLQAAVSKPFAFSQPGLVSHRSALIVRLVTAAGLVGYGEGACFGFQPADASATVVRDVLAPMVIGRRIGEQRVIYLEAFNRLRDFGATGSVTAALSAMDIALWDLRGRALGCSVSTLLGGRFRERVQAYVTSFYSGDVGPQPEESAEQARRFVSEGYKALKLKVGFGLKHDELVVRSVREAIPDGVGLLVDANRGYDLGLARRLVSIAEAHDVLWLEEPMPVSRLGDYRALRAQAGSVLVAAGESESGPTGFWPLMVDGAVDVLQPDLGMAGGFSGTMPIADMALASGQAVCPHVWGTAIGQAAALQFVATIPRSPMSRGGFEPLFEFDLSDHPFRKALTTSQLTVADGFVTIPDGPGIGVVVDEEALEAYSIHRYDVR